MSWQVIFHPQFKQEFDRFSDEVQDELASLLSALRDDGPMLGRPHADTLNGSSYPNMKELRFRADDGVWRAAFAFDPLRDAILLVAADKSGGSERAFYRRLIEKADKRFKEHLESIRERGLK